MKDCMMDECLCYDKSEALGWGGYTLLSIFCWSGCDQYAASRDWVLECVHVAFGWVIQYNCILDFISFRFF